MEHLSNDHKDYPNQQNNSHKLSDERRHPVLSLVESQWKLQDNHIRITQWKERHYRANTSDRRKKYIQKSRTVRVLVRSSSKLSE